MVMTDTAPADTPTVGRIEQLRQSLSSSEWRRVRWMVGSIIALHVIGFGVFVAFVVPSHYKGLGIGVSVLAYTLGLRHAFDADHISAIDNTTRKLMNERRGVEGSAAAQRAATCSPSATRASWWPSGWASSSPRRPCTARSRNNHSALEQFGGRVRHRRVGHVPLPDRRSSTWSSWPGSCRVFRAMRRGDYDEAELERQLENRGSDVPLLRPVDVVDHQGMADVPGRRGLRHGLRHRHRGRPAGHRPPCWPPSTCRGTRSSACPSSSPPGWPSWTRSTAAS